MRPGRHHRNRLGRGCRGHRRHCAQSDNAQEDSPGLQRAAWFRRWESGTSFEFTTAMQNRVASGLWLSPGSEAGGQTGWQFRSEDSILRCFQIVGRAMEVDELRVRVEDSESGAPVAVAGLSHRAGIDQISRAGLQLQCDRFGLPYGLVLRTQAVGRGFTDKKSALQMRMSKEG